MVKVEWVEKVSGWNQRVEPEPMTLIASLSGSGSDWHSVINISDEGEVNVDLISYQGATKLGIYLGSNMVLVAHRV